LIHLGLLMEEMQS